MGAPNIFLQDNIVHYADPAMRASMLARLILMRTDYLRKAEELAHFAQSTEIELRGRVGRDVVNNVQAAKPDTCKCYTCEKRALKSEVL